MISNVFLKSMIIWLAQIISYCYGGGCIISSRPSHFLIVFREHADPCYWTIDLQRCEPTTLVLSYKAWTDRSELIPSSLLLAFCEVEAEAVDETSDLAE